MCVCIHIEKNAVVAHQFQQVARFPANAYV